MENLRNLSRWGMFAFLSVALCTSFVGCSDDDPDYSNVTPPTVSVRSGETVQGNNRHRCRKRKRSQCRMERVIAQ